MRSIYLLSLAGFLSLAAACSSKSSGSSPAAATPPASGDASGTTDTTTTAVSPTPTTAAVSGTAIALAFTNAALNEAVATCGALTIATNDGTGTAAAVTSAHVINLTSNATTGAFYSDSACANASGSVTVASGATSATIYYRDSAAGTPTVTATDDASSSPVLTTVTQQETISASGTGTSVTLGTTTTTGTSTPGAAAKLAFMTATIGQSSCSPLTLQVQDANANVVPVTIAAPIVLATTSTTGAFFTDSSCTTSTPFADIAVGGSSLTVFYKDTTISTPTISATPAATSGLTAASQTLTVSAPLPAFNIETNIAQGLNRCWPLTFDLPAQTADVAVTLATQSTVSGAGFYSTSACTTPITSYSVGIGNQSFTVFYKEPAIQSDTLTISSPTFTPYSVTIKFN